LAGDGFQFRAFFWGQLQDEWAFSWHPNGNSYNAFGAHENLPTPAFQK
jgi:hypothetical protein